MIAYIFDRFRAGVIRALPEKFRGIMIQSMRYGEYFIHQVTNWPALAKVILGIKKRAQNAASELYKQLMTFGCVQLGLGPYKSDGFGDISVSERKAILNNAGARITIFDRRVQYFNDDLQEFNVNLMSIRSVRNTTNNQAHERDFCPGLFVDGGRKMSQNEALKITGQGGGAKMKMRRLKTQFNEQESDDRVDEEINGHMVSYGLP